jgi:hypothetical protein
METRDDTFDLTPYLGDGLVRGKAANDSKTLDARFEETLRACSFWKWLPQGRVRAMTTAQRVRLAELRARVRAIELDLGVTF